MIFDFVAGVASADAVSSNDVDVALAAVSLNPCFSRMIRLSLRDLIYPAHLWNENPSPDIPVLEIVLSARFKRYENSMAAAPESATCVP
jgi:hypothetical protein